MLNRFLHFQMYLLMKNSNMNFSFYINYRKKDLKQLRHNFSLCLFGKLRRVPVLGKMGAHKRCKIFKNKFLNIFITQWNYLNLLLIKVSIPFCEICIWTSIHVVLNSEQIITFIHKSLGAAPGNIIMQQLYLKVTNFANSVSKNESPHQKNRKKKKEKHCSLWFAKSILQKLFVVKLTSWISYITSNSVRFLYSRLIPCFSWKRYYGVKYHEKIFGKGDKTEKNGLFGRYRFLSKIDHTGRLSKSIKYENIYGKRNQGISE